MRTASILVTVVLVFSTVSQAHAWDERGHRVIALIANHYLEAPVRKQVEAMLTADEDPLALHDIAGAATWADRYRDSATPEHDKSTTNWHFAAIYANRPNIPEACFGQVPLPAGTPASKGSGYACIIDKIDQFRAELSNPSTDAAERLLALKYLLHLV
ncbi:MAG: S1/P1 nuclease, partial [Rhodospirillaceae bacterium]|nr:S1/P1 nuclease [Rhodospirillaceae bacterium]